MSIIFTPAGDPIYSPHGGQRFREATPAEMLDLNPHKIGTPEHDQWIDAWLEQHAADTDKPHIIETTRTA